MTTINYYDRYCKILGIPPGSIERIIAYGNTLIVDFKQGAVIDSATLDTRQLQIAYASDHPNTYIVPYKIV